MLRQISIKKGYGFVNGEALHFKLISAAASVRLVASWKGSTEVETQVRAPMAIAFSKRVDRMEFYSEVDQTIEIWSGILPLEYLQLTAVGANRVTAKTVGVNAVNTLILEPNQRKSVRLVSDKDLLISGQGFGDGWPLKAGEKENFEVVGAIHAVFRRPFFDVNSMSGAGDQLYETDPTVSLALNVTSIAYFKGKVYAAIISGGNGVEFDESGVATQRGELGGCSIAAGNGYLYKATMASSSVKILRSDDGENFEYITEVAFAGQLSDVQQNLAGDWWLLIGSGASAKTVVVNVRTGEIIDLGNNSGGSNLAFDSKNTRLLRLTQGTSANSGIYVKHGSEWVSLVSHAQVPVNYRKLEAADGGRVFVYTNDSIYELIGNELVLTLGNAGNGTFAKPLNGTSGVAHWNTNGQLNIQDGISEGSAQITNMEGAWPFIENKTLFVVQTGGSFLRLKKFELVGLPEYETANVTALEFLI